MVDVGEISLKFCKYGGTGSGRMNSEPKGNASVFGLLWMPEKIIHSTLLTFSPEKLDFVRLLNEHRPRFEQRSQNVMNC